MCQKISGRKLVFWFSNWLYLTVSPVYRDLENVQHTWKLPRKSWNFALNKGEEPRLLKPLLDTVLHAFMEYIYFLYYHNLLYKQGVFIILRFMMSSRVSCQVWLLIDCWNSLSEERELGQIFQMWYPMKSIRCTLATILLHPVIIFLLIICKHKNHAQKACWSTTWPEA